LRTAGPKKLARWVKVVGRKKLLGSRGRSQTGGGGGGVGLLLVVGGQRKGVFKSLERPKEDLGLRSDVQRGGAGQSRTELIFSLFDYGTGLEERIAGNVQGGIGFWKRRRMAPLDV